MTFREGDVVSRKTDGQFMTVEETRRDELVSVVWLDREGRAQRDCFSPKTLIKWVEAKE